MLRDISNAVTGFILTYFMWLIVGIVAVCLGYIVYLEFAINSLKGQVALAKSEAALALSVQARQSDSIKALQEVGATQEARVRTAEALAQTLANKPLPALPKLPAGCAPAVTAATSKEFVEKVMEGWKP